MCSSMNAQVSLSAGMGMISGFTSENAHDDQHLRRRT